MRVCVCVSVLARCLSGSLSLSLILLACDCLEGASMLHVRVLAICGGRAQAKTSWVGAPCHQEALADPDRLDD